MTKTGVWFALAILLSGGGVGCGSDDGPAGGSSNIFGGDDATIHSDTPGSDAGGADAFDATGQDALGPDTDAQGSDVGEGSDSGDSDTGGDTTIDLCDGQDLGEIAADQSATASADLADAINAVEVSCSRPNTREIVFSFSLAQPSRVAISTSSTDVTDWNLQINQGDCDATREFVCFNNANETVFLEGGVEYHLIVEPGDRETSGQVQVDLTTEALGCFPSGSTQCAGGDVQICGNNFTPVTETCSHGCSGGSCSGDTCENAIAMDPSDSMLLEGELDAFRNTYNFGSRDECFDSGFGLSSRGTDIAVALDGLTAGQVVRVDASENVGDFNDNTIFVVDSCGATPSCVTGGDDETLEWTAPTDGDYVLIIDTISEADHTFAYQIDIEDAQ